MKVGFIGLGNMGAHQARRLLENGFELHLYNRTESKADPLVRFRCGKERIEDTFDDIIRYTRPGVSDTNRMLSIGRMVMRMRVTALARFSFLLA